MRALVSLLVVVALWGCEPVEDPPPGIPKALIVGIDGVRADALEVADTPEMDALMASGAWTLDGTTQLTGPTVSGPGWTSILTGFEVIDHGIVNNDGWDNRRGGTPTWLLRAHDAGIATVASIHWVPLLTGLIEDGALDDQTIGIDDEVTDQMADFVRAGEHTLHFVHLDDVDAAGHGGAFSPDDPGYIEAIEAQDARIGRMMRAIESRPETEAWLVGVTTDHGGEGSGHGGLNEANRRIPVILNGPGYEGTELEGGGAFSQMDPMTTAAAHVGVEIDDRWGLAGRVVTVE